jgi:hypothetical protein
MRPSPGAKIVRLLLCMCIAVFLANSVVEGAQASERTGDQEARTAKRVKLVEVGHLELSKEEGSAITERGRATGTYNAPVTAAFTIHPKSVTVVVTLYPTGGSITGTAIANYKVANGIGYFGGYFKIGRGTGKYRHVSEVDGKPLGFSGTINRNSLKVEVKVNKGEINV